MEATVITAQKVKFEFEVVIVWENKGRFASFPQAFAFFYNELNKAIAQGLPGGTLGTCNIDCYMDGEMIGPLMFEQIKELAEEMGLLVAGKLADPISEFNLRQALKFYVLLAAQLNASAEAFLAHIERAKARCQEMDETDQCTGGICQGSQDQG